MALETPNQIHATASCLAEIVSVGPSAFSIEMQSSEGFSDVRFFEPDDTEATIFTMIDELSPLQAAIYGNGSNGGLEAAFIGPPFDPFGLPSIDDLKPNELLVAWDLEFAPFEVGSQVRPFVQVFALPLVGV